MIHVLNGQVMSITVDDDPLARAPQGILSLQVEGSGEIWYRNVYSNSRTSRWTFRARCRRRGVGRLFLRLLLRSSLKMRR